MSLTLLSALLIEVASIAGVGGKALEGDKGSCRGGDAAVVHFCWMRAHCVHSPRPKRSKSGPSSTSAMNFIETAERKRSSSEHCGAAFVLEQTMMRRRSALRGVCANRPMKASMAIACVWPVFMPLDLRRKAMQTTKDTLARSLSLSLFSRTVLVEASTSRPVYRLVIVLASSSRQSLERAANKPLNRKGSIFVWPDGHARQNLSKSGATPSGTNRPNSSDRFFPFFETEPVDHHTSIRTSDTSKGTSAVSLDSLN